MKIHTIPGILGEVPFFKDLKPEYREFLAGCARNVHFKPGEFLLLAGKDTTHFYLIREGHVALEMEAGNKVFSIQTIGEGQILGWSWLVPPYTWHYDARAVEPVSAISFDAKCVREKCEKDPVFGYELLKRFSRLIAERLMATRIQMADLYQ